MPKGCIFSYGMQALNICTGVCFFFSFLFPFSFVCVCVCSFAGWLVGCLPVPSIRKCTNETSSSLATLSFEEIM